MYWLFLLFALAAFATGLVLTHAGAMALAMLVALLLALCWARGLYLARFGTLQQDMSQLVDPEQLRQLRQRAQQARQERDGEH